MNTTPLAALRCVLFDLDGTFADTAPDLAHALNHILQQQGRAPLPLLQVRPFVSHGAAALVAAGFPEVRDGDWLELRRRELVDAYRQQICRDTTTFPGIAELVEALELRAVRWGIVTNKPAALTQPLLTALGYWQRACCVVSGDTLPLAKPDPAPVLHACQLAGVAPAATLCVGDAERDIVSGRAAGCRTVVARFGYLDSTECPEAWGASGMIDHPQELLAWL